MCCLALVRCRMLFSCCLVRDPFPLLDKFRCIFIGDPYIGLHDCAIVETLANNLGQLLLSYLNFIRKCLRYCFWKILIVDLVPLSEKGFIFLLLILGFNSCLCPASVFLGDHVSNMVLL